MCFKVESGTEYTWRYGGESTMVIMLVYISSLSPYLSYLYRRPSCMFSNYYDLGGPKQSCSVCDCGCIGW